MKATGIVRRIDDLGRVVIPKEIRRTMRIRDGEPLEIYIARDGGVILKKYFPMQDLGQFAQGYADSLYEVLGHVVCVADRGEIIAVAGRSKKDILNKSIGTRLEEIINNRQTVVLEEDHSITTDDRYSFKNSVVAPITSNDNIIGAVIITSDEQAGMGDLERKLAETAADFLAKQVEG